MNELLFATIVTGTIVLGFTSALYIKWLLFFPLIPDAPEFDEVRAKGEALKNRLRKELFWNIIGFGVFAVWLSTYF